MINHWNNATPLQPHTIEMRERAKELWAEAGIMSDADIYDPADIDFLLDIAADLERFAFWPVVFAEPLSEGECAHVLPEQSCIYCQPKDDDYDFTNPTQNPYILSGEELKRAEELI